MADGAGGGGGASFDGKITGWPSEESLNICNVPIEQKAFIRYFACEWVKNQPVGNVKSMAQQAIQSAQVLYNELASRGYMDS